MIWMESLISRLAFAVEVFNSRLFHMSRQLWREDYYKVLGVPRNASQKESQLKMSLLLAAFAHVFSL